MIDANALFDNAIRGTAISAILRVATGKPVLVMGTLNDGARFAGASLVYDLVKDPVNQVLPAAIKLPNGK